MAVPFAAGPMVRIRFPPAASQQRTVSPRSAKLEHQDRAKPHPVFYQRRVECAARDHDRYGRTVALCRTESGELNAAMVLRGWAVDYTRYSGERYRAEEQQARTERLGIWSGQFDMPEQRRHRGQ
jgi:hypothetical protein